MINIYIEVTGDTEQVKYQLPVEDLELSADKARELPATLERLAGRLLDAVQS